MNDDYYRILGVERNASTEEIRKAYRKRAFELHPDRHGGSREAEERFKELTEAYAVLNDPEKRRVYDAVGRGAGGGPNATRPYEPGDVFSGLFRDPAFRSLFEEMSREFARQGLRFDEAYVRRVFHGSRGPVVFGGVFFMGSLGTIFSQLLGQSRPQTIDRDPTRQEVPSRKPGLLRRLLHVALPGPRVESSPAENLDVHYQLPVGEDLLATGGVVRIALPLNPNNPLYQVRVPAGTRAGTRLRLAGRGREENGRRGDLYLQVLRSDPT